MLLKDELLLEIIDQLPIAVFAKNPNDNYKFVIWNKKMASLFSLPKEKVIGTTDFDFFDDIEEAKNFRRIDEGVMARGHVIDMEEVVTTINGEITCHTLKLPLQLADGRQLLVGIIDDITEESANKKQLNAYRDDLESLVKKRTLQLQNLANIDSLTKLGNRSFFLFEIEKLIKNRCLSKQFSVMFIDLNGFKLLNDSYGHRLGDELLYLVGQRLNEFRDQAPIVSRLGGDEFVLIIKTGDDQALASIAQSLYDAISLPYTLRSRSFQITCAIGISTWPKNGGEATLLLQAADMAMYDVKNLRSNSKHYQFYDEEMLALSQRKLELQQSLRDAITNNELYLVLQPQFSLDDQCGLCGAEILLRWQSEKFGLVSPLEFIPIAEKSDLILSISAWVLQQSCLLVKNISAQFTHIPRISVNLSGDEISIGLAERISKQLEQYEFSAQVLTLEITEAQLVNFSDDVISELEQLRQQGFRISLDDFGTGYSSMSYLSSLEFDEIKIDRSFITKINNDKKALLLVRTIVSMAKALESKVVAEGVETTDQFDCLKDMGVDIIQGYLLGKPMRYEDFISSIKSGEYKISAASSKI
ncbi:MAG: diguanylate cyclase (GGDEF)-like protein/PAS domain S-box-containing protein [Candidatus Endobugula sp.]|jgi:diguanylate cyclase (GGDEF)-like protein/PAS domain S-box-containing protein